MQKMNRAVLRTDPGQIPGQYRAPNWRAGLPVLAGKKVQLRELRASDAEPLFSRLRGEEVAFISPPPTTVEGFERFIAWTIRERSAGKQACFAITMAGEDAAVGVIQVRETEPGFCTGEWGFAVSSLFWGSGVFEESAELILEFVFDVLGVHRLESRVAVQNGRGHGAVRKIGAVQEGILRRSLRRDGQSSDQVLYAIVEDDWRASRAPYSPLNARVN
jgi:RimJ/RimL family protein N-acetyltransferase